MRLPACVLIVSASVASFVMLATGCGSEPNMPGQDPVHEPAVEPRSMVAFSSCEDLVGFARNQLREEVDRIEKVSPGGGLGVGGTVGMGGTGAMGGTGGMIPDNASPLPGADAQDQSGDAPQNPNDPNHSDTNNQTQGVDEPDLIKTDGKRLFTITQGTLRILQLDGTVATITDTLRVGPDPFQKVEMLIHHNRLLVFVQVYQGNGRRIEVLEVDASQPGQAKIVARLSIAGTYVSARKINSVVRVVLRTSAKRPEFRRHWPFLHQARNQLGMPQGITGDTPEVIELAKRMSRAHNDELLKNIRAEDLLPSYRLERDGQLVSQGSLYGCEQAMRPGVASGLDMLSVLSIDMDAGLTLGSGTGVLSEGSTLYASESSLYVATPARWTLDRPMPGSTTTQGSDSRPNSGSSAETTYIHKFDIRDPKTAVYQATGSVDGRLLNQFAMSEHQGVLRVAATRYLRTGWRPVDSFVATLKDQGKFLVELGRASGLGKTENIRSVRFMGDIGYVVTFRQTDPLYTLDLTNPAAPTVLGELKIDGYSAYLHPLSPGYLVGVGRDADPSTGVERGLQVSIFDARDLKAPKRIHNFTLQNMASTADRDHRAFLYWPQSKSLVLPVRNHRFTPVNSQEFFNGALILGIDPESGIQERSRITHFQKPGTENAPTVGHTQIHRSVVVNDALWTLSDAGVLTSSLQNGEQRSWLANP